MLWLFCILPAKINLRSEGREALQPGHKVEAQTWVTQEKEEEGGKFSEARWSDLEGHTWELDFSF